MDIICDCLIANGWVWRKIAEGSTGGQSIEGRRQQFETGMSSTQGKVKSISDNLFVLILCFFYFLFSIGSDWKKCECYWLIFG